MKALKLLVLLEVEGMEKLGSPPAWVCEGFKRNPSFIPNKVSNHREQCGSRSIIPFPISTLLNSDNQPKVDRDV